MSTLRDVPLWLLLALRIRLKVHLWRLLAMRAAWRLVRRAIDWLAPVGRPANSKRFGVSSLGLRAGAFPSVPPPDK